MSRPPVPPEGGTPAHRRCSRIVVAHQRYTFIYCNLTKLVLVGWQGHTTARCGAGAFQSLRESLGRHREILVPWALVANWEIVGFGPSRAFSSVKPMADGEALVDSRHFQRAEGPGTAARIAALRRALGCGEALRGSDGGRLRGAGAGSRAGILPAVPGPAGYRRRHWMPATRLRMKTPPELPGTSSRRIERRRSAVTASSTSAKIPVGSDKVESPGQFQNVWKAVSYDQNVEVWHRLPGAPLRNRVEGCSQEGHFDSGRVSGCPPPSCSICFFGVRVARSSVSAQHDNG